MSSPRSNTQKNRYEGRIRKDLCKAYAKRLQFEFKASDCERNRNGEQSTHSACRKYSIQARSTVMSWLRKHGNFDWENQTPSNMAKTPEQRIMELEAEVNLLKKQKTFLEKQACVAYKKAIIFDIMINLVRKNMTSTSEKTYHPNNRQLSQQRKRKFNLQLWIVRVEQTSLLQEYKENSNPQNKASQVIELVENLRLNMPKLGSKKLYFLLQEELKYLKIGRDRFFDILRANHYWSSRREVITSPPTSTTALKAQKSGIRLCDYKAQSGLGRRHYVYRKQKESGLFKFDY